MNLAILGNFWENSKNFQNKTMKKSHFFRTMKKIAIFFHFFVNPILIIRAFFLPFLAFFGLFKFETCEFEKSIIPTINVKNRVISVISGKMFPLLAFIHPWILDLASPRFARYRLE